MKILASAGHTARFTWRLALVIALLGALTAGLTPTILSALR